MGKKDEYRLLRKPSSENQIIGHYNDKQCTLDTAEKMKEGKYKRFVVDGGYKEVTHHLQVGDYYYADGSVVSGNEAEPAKDNCIGIVCWVEIRCLLCCIEMWRELPILPIMMHCSVRIPIVFMG